MSGFRRMMMANAKPYSKELLYLENATSQYIDTGIVATSDITTDISVVFVTANANTCPIGQTSGTIAQLYSITANAGLGVIACQFGADIITIDKISIILDQKFNFNLGKGGWFVNGVKISDKSNISFTSPNTLYLFARNNNGNAERFSNARIYSCRLYNGETIVRDFIPVLDNQGVPCMYDKVSKTLFYNKGTGQFTYGE